MGSNFFKRNKFSQAQKICIKATGRAMQQLEMIGPNTKLGVAVSGGVDSFVMLKILHLRQLIVPFKYDIIAIHLNAGFDTKNHLGLVEWCKEHGIASHIEVTDHGTRAHSEENRKDSACFYCAMLRRKRLFEICQQYNLTHLAFGHNSDDLVNTFFMNLMQNGRVDGLNPCDDFFGGKLKVIRPLILVEKNDIIKAANKWELPLFENPCPSAGLTKRTEIEDKLKEIYSSNKLYRSNIFSALSRWQMKNTLDKNTVYFKK